MTALDSDGNGELSKAEIAKASQSLMTLDKNKDGVINAEEMRPEFGRGGPGGRGGPDMSGEVVERIFGFDANKDGKLTADELPERMKSLLERADANKDGVLDRQEVTTHARRQTEGGRPRQEPREPEKGERGEGRGRNEI
jgi:Ca2+-binding EF-hand superfamily protein